MKNKEVSNLLRFLLLREDSTRGRCPNSRRCSHYINNNIVRQSSSMCFPLNHRIAFCFEIASFHLFLFLKTIRLTRGSSYTNKIRSNNYTGSRLHLWLFHLKCSRHCFVSQQMSVQLDTLWPTFFQCFLWIQNINMCQRYQTLRFFNKINLATKSSISSMKLSNFWTQLSFQLRKLHRKYKLV